MTDPGGRYDFAYVHTDIPPGMTIAQWRASTPHPGSTPAGLGAVTVIGRLLAWLGRLACGWRSVLSATRSAARVGDRQALPDGSLRES